MTRLPKSRAGPDKAAATQSHVSIHGPGEFLTVPDSDVSDQPRELRAVFSPGVAGRVRQTTALLSAAGQYVSIFLIVRTVVARLSTTLGLWGLGSE